MERLLNRLVLICGLLGMAFGGYAYVTEKPTTVVAKLEEKVDREVEKVYDTMEARRVERNKEIAELKKELNDSVTRATGIVVDRLNKIDDRLYEMQRNQNSARSDY